MGTSGRSCGWTPLPPSRARAPSKTPWRLSRGTEGSGAMPIDPHADAEITAFRWVPPFAQGLVRDLRLRWALEEIGRAYSVRLLDATKPRPADYFCEQPWGQVPVYKDKDVELFESGAILIHLGMQDERLLPTD